MNWDYLNNQAYKHFDCQWLSAVERHENKVSERQRKKRLEKQRQVGGDDGKVPAGDGVGEPSEVKIRSREDAVTGAVMDSLVSFQVIGYHGHRVGMG